MDKFDFPRWLRDNYGRGQRLAFVADFNAVAESLGASPISLGANGKLPPALNNWLCRNPPAQYGGLPFEQFLALVLQRKDTVIQVAKIYRLAVPVDKEMMEFLEAEAAESGTKPEHFLLTTLLGQLDDELEIHTRKRPKGKK